VASREGLDSAALFESWEEFRTSIAFEDVEVGATEEPCRDPKDLPYLRLHQTTGRPVYTVDADLAGMGAAVIGIEVVGHLRDYSRSASIEFSVKIGGVAIGGLSLASNQPMAGSNGVGIRLSAPATGFAAVRRFHGRRGAALPEVQDMAAVPRERAHAPS
jgi:hypothetical protein